VPWSSIDWVLGGTVYMLWVLEVAFIFCVSRVGFWCEPLRVGFSGSVVRWDSRVFGGFTDFEEVELRDRRWMSVGLVGC
jgi:hypothetical protein